MADYPSFNISAKSVMGPEKWNAMLASRRLPSLQSAKKVRAGLYSQEQIGLEQQNEAERMRREGSLADLDRAWANPERMASLERTYSTGLQNQLAGLQQGYKQQSQAAGLAAARRGRLGSSYDAETQSRLQHGLQSDIMGAEQQSYGQLQQLKDADEQQRQALRRSILSGDPQTAASLQQQAAGYGTQASQYLQQAQAQEEAERRRQQQQEQGYGMLGDLLSTGGRAVKQYYGGY